MNWLGRAIAAIARLVDFIVRRFVPCVPPEHDEARWNDANVGGQIQNHNNCYNYACDIITGTSAWPGGGSGHPSLNATCASLSAGVQSDGLIPSKAGEPCGDGGCWIKVALVLWPETWDEANEQYAWDFHFYRQDRDGTWSHKPGSGPATNKDQNGNAILNPETAIQGTKYQFCGYFCVPMGSVTIK